ncbi:integration host factor subunit beta [Alphaproteobacteria bacterium]|nr:integration host factor subunit beta [Alphaproteobacteria bacterium]
MTKSEIVARLHARMGGLGARYVGRTVDVILEQISRTLAEGGRVELRKFGVFDHRVRAARGARNPRNGAAVRVSAKAVPFFKPGKGLKDRLNAKRG